MRVVTRQIAVETSGHGCFVDLGPRLNTFLDDLRALEGQLTVFVPGSTAAVTTIEFEDGCLQDLTQALEMIAPSDREYHHDRRWGDGNGFSHLRAALMGPSLTVPVADGRPLLGTWQQVTLADCDLHGRSRKVLFSFIGTTRMEDD